MIDYIKGVLVEVEPSHLVIETTNGIGYQIICANPYRFTGQKNKALTVVTYHYVREDFQRLYGFKHKQERSLFEKLLSVSGIGPKGALAVLAAGQTDQIVEAIEREDEALLTRFPGIGKKTARQIILDLKGKLEDFTTASLLQETPLATSKQENDQLADALEALKALGYVDKELNRVKKKLLGEDLETDEYIKRALALMLRT
ncbi:MULTISPECIES: Holliday junction branch migration protein RuvA [Shouchella]|uniref:Holliday junction branch migration complex subunit RuvA n=3 Tax=Bacillaceae TaxID=186817 RepID=A0A060LUV1_9BACI|nr:MULTISPECIES: Holliday junction branch migration protein RuvA [Bacillaceae]RQW19804.1 Holliday junction branch migration protein RuvA [Bacillus sp. C1-1]AIC93952.1 Holliday junction ATP-dependent DNA helicase RuvA [Shouchella lehensis G1]KQL55890.1 ATP-dependent DNA helicase RuvA [Alkalicoccobacillus plakortidis]MBG9785551.1 ATP-dependent DNA helicase RuvA [Shouchella lehensis]TES47990.1 Holliday junction branch migration protein RuvA [Shouchella lehensis]